MKNVLLALSLALALGPVAVLADTNATNAPPARPQLTQQQRQALEKTFETFRTQEEKLHEQLRTQVLNSISPAHRTTIAGIIGNLAISPNPDPQAAAKQLDTLLSQGEQQRILALHASFRTQSKSLHEQMKAQLASEMPAGPKPPGHDGWGGQNQHQMPNLDAGTLLLHVLSHSGMGHLGMWGHPMGMMGPGGPPRR